MDTHPRTPTQNSPLSARLGKRHSSSFTDELSLELGDGREQVEHQPAGVVVSIDSVSDRRCTSRRPNYSTSSTRCDRERPSRSRRHTVTTSPASTSASTRTSPGRSAAPRRPIDNSPLLVDTGRAQRGDLGAWSCSTVDTRGYPHTTVGPHPHLLESRPRRGFRAACSVTGVFGPHWPGARRRDSTSRATVRNRSILVSRYSLADLHNRA